MQYLCAVCGKPYLFPPEQTHPACVVTAIDPKQMVRMHPGNVYVLQRKFTIDGW